MSTRSRGTSTSSRLFVCLSNKGYKVSLEPRKIYAGLPDPDAARHGQLRIVDESGEDYLFPRSLFAPVNLPPRVRRAVLASVQAREGGLPQGNVPVRPRIVGVHVTGPFQLLLEFEDGSSGPVDLGPSIGGRGGVFAPLQDQEFFARVTVDHEWGTIVWPNGVDLDPDVLYDAAHGIPTEPASA